MNNIQIFKFKEYRFIKSSIHTKISFCRTRNLSLQNKKNIIPKNNSLSRIVPDVGNSSRFDSYENTTSIINN